MKKILITLAAVITLGSSANATIFRFQNPGSTENLGNNATFTVDGQTVNVSAFSFIRNPASYNNEQNEWIQTDVIHTGGGALGVNNQAYHRGGDNNQIDNNGWYDLLVIEIPELTEGERIRFTNLQNNDDWIIGSSDTLFDFSSDPTPQEFFDALQPDVASGNRSGLSRDRWLTLNSDSSNYFYIGGAELTGNPGQDDLYVTAFEVETSAAVPEPSTYALFGLGVVGLVLARRKVRS